MMRTPRIRALDLAQQAGQHRIGPGLAAEERHLDAAGEVLIDQHGDMLVVFQGLGELERRVAAGRNQRPHVDRAYPLDGTVGRFAVRPPVQDGAIQSVRDRAQRGQVPNCRDGS